MRRQISCLIAGILLGAMLLGQAASQTSPSGEVCGHISMRCKKSFFETVQSRRLKMRDCLNCCHERELYYNFRRQANRFVCHCSSTLQGWFEPA